MIVEDEILEREVLDEMISRSYPEISEIYSVNNGIDALRAAQNKNPDIVLIDINIPGIGGLALLEELQKNDFQGKCIITTAYDSFNYAKEAIRYGAIGYLLKPIMDDELRECMCKACAMIDSQRESVLSKTDLSTKIRSICSYSQRYLVRDILAGMPQEHAMTCVYGWPSNGTLSARVLLLTFEKELTVEDQNSMVRLCSDTYSPLYSILIEAENNLMWVLIQPQTDSEADRLEVTAWAMAASVSMNALQSQITVSIRASALCSTYTMLQEESQRLIEKNTGRKEQENTPGVLFLPSIPHNIYDARTEQADIQKASRFLRDGQPDHAIGLFRKCFRDPSGQMLGVYLVLQAAAACESGLDIADACLAALGDPPSKQLIEWLRSNISIQENSGSDLHTAITEALRIIKEEYASPELPQQMVAERLGLSTAYFCRLFKKETGKNFVPVLTQIRMEHAASLICSGVPPESAGQKCGYLNSKYFCDAFKMHYGISVSLYRQKSEVHS